MGKLKQMIPIMKGSGLYETHRNTGSSMGFHRTDRPSFGGESDTENCLSFITYIVSFIVFAMAINTIYSPTISLLGVILLYLINIVYSVILTKDLFDSPKAETSSIIVFIIIAVLGLNIASSTMIMLTIRKINADYAQNEKKMELSEKTRNILSTYVAGWIFTILMVGVLSIFYFIEPSTSSFFSYEFIGKDLSPLIILIGFIIKSVFSIVSLAISGYMVYKAKQFSDVKTRTVL